MRKSAGAGAGGREAPERDWLEGKVARVLWSNDATGFTVFLLSVKRSSDPSQDRPGRWEKVCGTFLKLRKGEPMKVYGAWEQHPKYQRTFKVSEWALEEPPPPAAPGETSPESQVDARGFERYLASVVQGVGPETARRLVEALGAGEARRAVEEGDTAALERVPGIGPKKAAAIAEGWADKVGGRALLVFLLGLGLGAASAASLQRMFSRRRIPGSTAIAQIKESPYRLAEEVRGVGFHKADRIARSLGVPPSSPYRYRAALVHALRKAAEENGHCGLPLSSLLKDAEKLLVVEKAEVEEEDEEGGYDESTAPYVPDEAGLEREVRHLESAGEIVIENVAEPGAPKAAYVSSTPTFETERAVARRLADLQRSAGASGKEGEGQVGSGSSDEEVSAWIVEYEREVLGFALHEEQREAVRKAARGGVTGPAPARRSRRAWRSTSGAPPASRWRWRRRRAAPPSACRTRAAASRPRPSTASSSASLAPPF